MAILFTTGTINAANQAAVGQAMAEKIRDDVVAHAAWDLVEEYTPASSVMTWYVFKCLAAQSGLPSDFYVIVGRQISNGELRVIMCETYTQATHTMQHYGSNQGGAAVTYDSSGRNPATFVLSTAQLSTSPTTTPRWQAWTPSGVSTKWWITVDNDGFSVAFSGAANGFWHAGAFTPLSALANDMPLLLAGSDQGNGMLTRNPALASVTYTGFGLYAPSGGISTASIVLLGFVGSLSYNDKLQGDQRPVAELGVTMYENTTGERQTNGWAMGKQKRVRAGVTPPAGFTFGDAYTLNGRLWVPYLATDPRMWDTGVAV